MQHVSPVGHVQLHFLNPYRLCVSFSRPRVSHANQIFSNRELFW